MEDIAFEKKSDDQLSFFNELKLLKLSVTKQ